MSIIEKLKWRYATKKFDISKSLSLEQLNTLKEAFNLTALSYGLQTLKLVVVEDKNKREQLVEHSYGQRQVADSSHLLVICIQNEINESEKLRTESKKLLDDAQTKLNSATSETEKILNEVKDESEKLIIEMRIILI